MHSNEELHPSFSGIYMKPTANDGTTTSGTQPWKKYVNNGKGWYFRFDDDNKMSYKYVLSTT